MTARPLAGAGAGDRVRPCCEGFSLIELSVAIAIMGLLTWAVGGAYGNSTRQGARDAAVAQGETMRDLIRSFALVNRRLPCPDTSGSGWENCAGGELGWLPYSTLGLDIPSPTTRAAYGVYRNAAINADLAVVAERTGNAAGTPGYQDIRDLIAGAGFVTAQAPGVGHLYLTGNDGAGGAVDCANNKVAIPAFVVALPLRDMDGDGSLFDGVQTGLPGNIVCFQSQNTPPNAIRDDVVINESLSTLMGWLSAHTI